MALRIGSHIRHNVVAYVALFFALAGTAWATVTQIDTGPGLTGGPITTTGTISVAGSYQLPQSCAAQQIPKSNGAGTWSCSPDVAAAHYKLRNGRGFEISTKFPKFTSIGSFTLPVGNYLVLGRAEVSSISKEKPAAAGGGSAPGGGLCRLDGGADAGSVSSGGASRSYPSVKVPVHLQAVVRIHTAPREVAIECTRMGPHGGMQVGNGNLTAIRIGELDWQQP